MATMLQLLDFLGVAVFAVTGGIVASRLRLDFLAFLFFGASEYLSLSVLDEKAAELREFIEINFGLAVAIYSSYFQI